MLKVIKSAATMIAAAAVAVASFGVDAAEARNNEHNAGKRTASEKSKGGYKPGDKGPDGTGGTHIGFKTPGGYKPGDKGPDGTGGTHITPHKDRPSSLEMDRYRSDKETGHFVGNFNAWRETQRQFRPNYGDDARYGDERKPNYGDDGRVSGNTTKTAKATLSDMWSGRVSDRDGSDMPGKRSAQMDRIMSGKAKPGLY